MSQQYCVQKIPWEGNGCHTYHWAIERLGQHTQCLSTHAADPHSLFTGLHWALTQVQKPDFKRYLLYHSLNSALREHRGTMQTNSCGCWVPPPPPTLSCLSELPRVSSYQKLFRSQDTTAICKWLKKLNLNRNPIELKITVDYSHIGCCWGGRGTGKKSTVTNPDITRLTPWNIFSLLCLLKSSYPKPQITLIWNILGFFDVKY